jgi:hypothetical protein
MRQAARASGIRRLRFSKDMTETRPASLRSLPLRWSPSCVWRAGHLGEGVKPARRSYGFRSASVAGLSAQHSSFSILTRITPGAGAEEDGTTAPQTCRRQRAGLDQSRYPLHRADGKLSLWDGQRVGNSRERRRNTEPGKVARSGVFGTVGYSARAAR